MINTGPRRLDPRQMMAQQLLQGGQTSGTGHWSDGLARGANMLLGAYLQREYGKEQDQKIEADRALNQATTQAAFRQLTGQPARTQTYGDGTAIDWEAQAPNMEAAGMTLANNPGTANMGQEVLFRALARKQGLADRDEQRQYEAGIREQENARDDARFKQTQDLQREIAQMRTDATGGAPAAVQEWQFFSQLPPDQQQQYLVMKRAAQMTDLGNVQAVINPLTGLPRTELPKGTAPQDKITDNGVISTPGRPGGTPMQAPAPTAPGAPQGGGPTVGEYLMSRASGGQPAPSPQGAGGVSVTPLPADPRERQRSVETANQALHVIDLALNFPGRESYTGPIQGRMPNVTPGATSFQAIMDQLGGKNFLQAFESLKGGGQITQVEGQKAQDAIARMNTAQGDADFTDALRELQSVVLRARGRAQGVPEDQLVEIYIPDWRRQQMEGGQTRAMDAPQGLSPEEERELQSLRARFAGGAR